MVKNIIKSVREKGFGGFLRELKHEGYLFVPSLSPTFSSNFPNTHQKFKNNIIEFLESYRLCFRDQAMIIQFKSVFIALFIIISSYNFPLCLFCFSFS